MRNPFNRRRRDPLEQALDAVEDVRAEAAKRAEGIRDAAAQAVELLGEAAPEARRHRVPIALGVIAAGVGIAIAMRGRRSEPELPPAAPPTETAADAAAKRAAAPEEPEPAEPKPAAEVEAETPREPRAATAESQAGEETSR
jgi:hypothetical protein